MSNIELLDNTRKIGNLLYNNNSGKVAFNDICRIMREVTGSSCLVISRKGKLLGASYSKMFLPVDELVCDKIGSFIDSTLNDRFLGVLSTKENVNMATLGFTKEEFIKYYAFLTPIVVSGKRLGTLFLYRPRNEYEIEDIILCEYSTSVIGLEMLRSVNEESSQELHKIDNAKSCISSMSKAELEACKHIFKELEGLEGIVVATRIADVTGIARSVIVNSLRKLESAGIIESKSSGMRGTFIKILNDAVIDEIEQS